MNLAPYLVLALKDLWVEEYLGSKHHSRVIDYHRHTKLMAKDDETPWCAAAMCTWLEEAGFQSPKSARAKDFLKYGIESKPQFGSILVFTRDGGGHVGFYFGETTSSYWVLGGNQDNSVSFKKYDKRYLLSSRLPIK